MMFSLAIVDMLTEGYLNGGGQVAGTGTIDPAGNVGPIGGIQQKLVGAQREGVGLFLAPESNCDEVVGHVPNGLTVVPVATLAQARATVEEWVETPDAQFPQCGTDSQRPASSVQARAGAGAPGPAREPMPRSDPGWGRWGPEVDLP